MTNDESSYALQELLRLAKERFDAMSQKDQASMLLAQRESWARGMAPCEHGFADWEDCAACRKAALE